MILHKYFYTVEAYLCHTTKHLLNRSKMVMGMISASITGTCWLPLLLRLVSGSSLHHLSESHAIRKICLIRILIKAPGVSDGASPGTLRAVAGRAGPAGAWPSAAYTYVRRCLCAPVRTLPPDGHSAASRC